MKKLTSIAILAVLVFTACEKKEPAETYGNIPGMGNAEGELQYTAYDIPEGIEIVGDITGIGDEAGIAIADVDFKSANEAQTSYPCYGSGGRWVTAVMTMRNTTGDNRTIFFPKGLLFKSGSSSDQHGMLLQWTWVCFKPNETRTFALHLYCINHGLDGSNASTNWGLCGITSSRTMWELLDHIGRRKVNYECYNSNFKSTSEDADYNEIITELQDAVWAMTNGEGLSQEQVDYIETLPELEEGTYPEYIVDSTLEAPYYFEEYTPAE